MSQSSIDEGRVQRVSKRLLARFESLCRTQADAVAQCHLLLCAHHLGLTANLFASMLTELERHPVAPAEEKSHLVQTFLRQVTLVQYDRSLDDRREFLARWLRPETIRQQDPVTVAWVMGLAAEQPDLIPAYRAEYARKWFTRHTRLKSLRARAWFPYYLERWGYTERAATLAREVLSQRLPSGSWSEGPPATAAAAYALACAQCVDDALLEVTAGYLLSRLEKGVDLADVTYPLNSIKFLFSINRIDRHELHLLAKRLESSVFLSHASTDADVARRLAKDLESHGVRVWVDEAQIQPGDSVIGKLEAGIAESRFVFLLASRASLRSPWVTEELRAAMHEGTTTGSVKVIPIRLDDSVLPPFLRDKKYVTLENYDAALDELLALFPDARRGPQAPGYRR